MAERFEGHLELNMAYMRLVLKCVRRTNRKRRHDPTLQVPEPLEDLERHQRAKLGLSPDTAEHEHRPTPTNKDPADEY